MLSRVLAPLRTLFRRTPVALPLRAQREQVVQFILQHGGFAPHHQRAYEGIIADVSDDRIAVRYRRTFEFYHVTPRFYGRFEHTAHDGELLRGRIAAPWQGRLLRGGFLVAMSAWWLAALYIQFVQHEHWAPSIVLIFFPPVVLLLMARWLSVETRNTPADIAAIQNFLTSAITVRVI